jgi:dipeptidyl aminopeptidase/acylaminoacyl peptidase
MGRRHEVDSQRCSMREYREHDEHDRSSNRTLWLVLGIGGGVVLVGILFCGGIGFLVVRNMQAGMAQMIAAQAQADELDLQDEDYTKARTQFKTKLLRQGPAPQQWSPTRLPLGAQMVEFKSGNLRLQAWLNAPNAADKNKLPAVLFLHGGWAFAEDDWEMTRPLRDAGYVVMAPMLRGENGQPGSFTMFYDEVDDVLAAADYLGKLPNVDNKHLYLAGHSAGGTLTMLAALASPRFRAAASFSGTPDQRVFAQAWQQVIPYDQSDVREFEMRSAIAYATSFKCPVRIYHGEQEPDLFNPSETTAQRARTRGLDVDPVAVPGNHTSCVPQAMTQAIQFFKEHGR